MKLKQLRRLKLPIYVGKKWLHRYFYKIRLRNNKIAKGKSSYVCASDYVIKLKFNKNRVTPSKFLRALFFVFSEVFFILRYNTKAKAGKQKRRLVLNADSLKTPVNLKRCPLNRKGVELLLSEIERTIQSNESLLVDDTLQIYFCSCKLP